MSTEAWNTWIKLNTQSDEFSEWIKHDPPPDLQLLIAEFGGYAKVPGEAWDSFAQDYKQWEMRRLDRLFGSRSWAIPLPKATKQK